MANSNRFDISLITAEEQIFCTNRKLHDKIFIGRFARTNTGYHITDIRRSDFSKIKYKPEGANAFEINTNGFFEKISEVEAYYRFTWKMVKTSPQYVFEIDENESIEKITSEEIIKLLYADIYDYKPSASEKIVNMLDTLKNQLTASGKEVFIYELLQNANDYPQKMDGLKQPVDVEFYLTDNYLIFQHSGDYFDAKNIAAICSINDKEKTDNAEAIGYKGIGFKTVFLDNNYVLLRTGEYQFRFDYEKTKDIDDTPWQILPIWTEDDEVDDEVLNIMDHADEKFRVQIALRPTEKEILRDTNQNYEKLFAEVFETERVILFIPFINSVSVYLDGNDEPTFVRVKENEKWCVSDPKKYIGDISSKLTEELNRRIDKEDGKIPRKYKNFHKTSVGFACMKDRNKLIPIEDTCLYCYLPAKNAKFGFKFLMNTDMIPTGPRDNIEPKENINHEIAKIAGQQFFHWIQDLIYSGEYDYESIFSLIPNFKELSEKYSENTDVLKFIKEFQNGFEDQLKEHEIIPVINDEDAIELVKINEINYDITGITCADIISDKELCRIANWKDYFPHPDLRDIKNLCYKPAFCQFLNNYVKNEHYIFDVNTLIDSCENEEFHEWLSDIGHNNTFLKFLLDKKYITQFKDKTIFKTEDGELKAAESVYENIDEYYPDLEAFDDYLPRLCQETRTYFTENEEWNEVKDELFRTFDADNFVDSELRAKKNLEDTKERLKEKETSLGFFNFLAKYVGYTDQYKEFPVIGFNDKVIEDFERKIFFYDEDGKELYDAVWTDDAWINLISDEYSDKAKEYFREKFKVDDFSTETFVHDILLTDSAREYLNLLGEKHIPFVQYCYEHKDLFHKDDLKNYSLWTYDKDGENITILSEDIIFFENELMDKYQEKSWIQNGWMYRLDGKYYDSVENTDDFENFLKKTFGVQVFTMESFYKNVIHKHDKEICSNVGGTETDENIAESIDVLTFLGENYKLIFEDHSNDKFISLPLYRYDNWDAVTNRDVKVYLYHEDLKELLEENWVPEKIVYMLEDKYNDVFTKYPALLKKLEIDKYSFKGFKEVLLNQIDSLKETTENKECNIAFHRFMLDKEDLTKSDYKTIGKIGLLASDNKGEEENHHVGEPLYISDVYMEAGKGVESMVRKYDETAYFTSNSYLSENADKSEVTAWKEYFMNLGVSYNIHDIIFNSIIPNLEDIKEKDIAILLAEYYYDFHEEGVWDTVINDLMKLNVVVKKGENCFLPLKDAIFNDCHEPEPYPYLIIENELSDIYQKPETMRLLHEIVESGKTTNKTAFKSINNIDSWKKEKLEWYLYLQHKDMSRLELIHVQFIQDLAKDYMQDPELYTRSKVKEILLKGKDGAYHVPKDLIEGSAYQPRCQFEQYNIKFPNGKAYLSEVYLPLEDADPKVFRRLFTDMNVVYDIHKEHFILMHNNYDFTVYFWSEYLTQHANRTHLTAIGTKELNNFACIPTCNAKIKEVKKPNQMYNLSIIRDGYVEGVVRNYEDKMPLETIFSTKEVSEILGNLEFAYSLTFTDCLDALLCIKDKEKRQKILSWLSNKSYIDEKAVDEYLQSEFSVWRNGKGGFTHLKDLYVLDIHATRLKQLFGKNAKVLASNYIESNYVFEAFCRVFKINALKEEDFKPTHIIIEEPTTEKMHKCLRLPLLIVAAVSNPEKWEDLYEGYCKKLEELTFYRCKSISLNYKDVLKDSSIQYHKKENEIYFVNDWMGRRVFKDLIADFVDYFGINMDNNMLEGIFEADEENQQELIEQYVDYELTCNSKFINALAELNEEIAKGVKVESQQEEDTVIDSLDYGTKVGIETQDDSEGETSKSSTDRNKNEFPEEEDEGKEEKTEREYVGGEKGNDENEDDEDSSNDSVKERVSPERSRYEGTNHSKSDPDRKIPSPTRYEKGEYTESHEKKDYPQRKSHSTHRSNYMRYYDPDETNNHPFNVGKQEPMTLETKDATEEEISRLSSLLGRAFDKDSIIDENYLVRMRFYNSVKKQFEDPELSEDEFVRKGDKSIKTRSGKWVHRCSARGGILYVAPPTWNKLKSEDCVICMYYGKKANQFLYIHSQKELMDMIDKDAIVVQVTGNNKGAFINTVFENKFPGMDGNIYVMIRTIKTSGDDFIFNPNDTQERNDNDFDPDLV